MVTAARNEPDWDEPALAISRRLTALIRAEIGAAGGLLPFDRFMDLALYAPGLGYYVAGAPKLGRGGDFVTAPEISPLFGACLANQCAEALERLGGGRILELGAGTGALAAQVLSRLKGLGALPQEYLILEPSPDLRERQRSRLVELAPDLAGLCAWIDRLPEGLRGVVLANEVLDAMPVHRFVIGERGECLEVCVRERDGQLEDIAVPVRSPGLAEAIARLQAEGLAQAPGFASEIDLRLTPWLAALGDTVEAGLVLIVDYGYCQSDYYRPDRTMGTLMCYSRQRAHDDPYRHIGLQDITAHVDFSAAARAAVAAGFSVAGFSTQAHFLIGCGIERLFLSESGPGPDAQRVPDLDLALGAKQLLLPSAMGERFKALGLAKQIVGPWSGFSVRDLRDRL